MRLPSIKTLEAAFPGKGKEIRDLLSCKGDSRSYKSVQEWEAQCYNKPRYYERLMCALNEVVEGFGVEPIWSEKNDFWPTAEYINMGDTYAATLLYDHTTYTIRVTSWGDWYERNEKRRKLK